MVRRAHELQQAHREIGSGGWEGKNNTRGRKPRAGTARIRVLIAYFFTPRPSRHRRPRLLPAPWLHLARAHAAGDCSHASARPAWRARCPTHDEIGCKSCGRRQAGSVAEAGRKDEDARPLLHSPATQG
jgi:hypothetical protein